MTFHVVGKINKQLVEQFMEISMQKLTKLNVAICSQGGHAYCARAIAGMIHTIRQEGVEVNTYGFGDINSAAVLIFAAGEERKLSKYASVMVHSDSGGIDGTTKDIMDYALMMEADDLSWCKAMADFTGTSLDKWIELHEDGDKYLTPEECLKLNLATEII